jgi:hypothetical protein
MCRDRVGANLMFALELITLSFLCTGKVFVSETLNHRILRFSSTICKKQAEKSENNHKIRNLYALILNQ